MIGKRSDQFGLALKRAGMILGAVALGASSLLPTIASAAQITARSVTLSSTSPAAGAASTTYSFLFTVPTTGQPIKSVSAQACTLSIGACVAPTGFANGVSTLPSQPTGLGAVGGWTVNTAGANTLRILNAANGTNPTGAVTLGFGAVQNPTTATGVSFYMRIVTYSDSAWTTPIDAGIVGTSTANLITVNADVAESLTFTTGLSGGTCAAVASSGSLLTLSANPLSSGSTSTGVAAFCAATNASTGYSVQYSAAQFASGANNMNLGSNSTSTPGTEMFGFNIPAASVVGPGTGVSSNAAYNTAAQYTFVGTGALTTLATVAGPSDYDVFTLNFVANISTASKAGHYQTTMMFVCTGTF